MIALAERVKEKYIDLKKSRVKTYPCHVNRASSIGHPCERYLVLMRTAWDKKPLHDWELQAIFDEGNIQEKATENDLREAGFEIIEQQRPYMYNDPKITGHIDGKILLETLSIPYEIKSMSPYIYQSINSVKDMLNHKYPHVRAYPGQLTLYVLMDNKEQGLFILKNKVNGQIKPFDLSLDYQYAESLLKKAERIDRHVIDGTLPDFINETSVCERCSYRSVCMPDMGGVEFDNSRVIEWLDERQAIIEMVDESGIVEYQKRLDELNKLLRKVFEEKPKVIAGDYFISGAWRKTAHGQYWNLDIIYGGKSGK